MFLLHRLFSQPLTDTLDKISMTLHYVVPNGAKWCQTVRQINSHFFVGGNPMKYLRLALSGLTFTFVALGSADANPPKE